MNILAQTILIIAAVGGFCIAFFIGYKKRKQENMVCPLNFSCEPVINSEYSKFLGLPVEILGMIYFGVVAVSYAAMTLYPVLVSPTWLFAILGATVVAFIFSMYLVFIQAFNIRQWCSWCLFSASLCTVIFLTSIIGTKLDFISILAVHKNLIGTLHLLGIALGLGGATIVDVFFFKFLKDHRISESEADIMHTFSQIIWFGLAILIISGLGLYLPAASRLNETPKFLVKMIGLIVIVVNGAFLNLLISPKLIKVSLNKQGDSVINKTNRTRRLAFALGAVSITSWYSVFLLGALRNIRVSFLSLLGVYIGLVIIAVIASQIMDRRIIQSEEGNKEAIS